MARKPPGPNHRQFDQEREGEEGEGGASKESGRPRELGL